ncbi:chemotaxis response regulator protein-glutamate methylesterase [Corallococcus sp. H22C18031201]|nr:chemotaxis-specific protein-glutamate methyltransferase CheB [Citreicoccus inhibens]RJS27583.1 chemotaxis response regulator protein-glutamate methylesterase [Corallococcus sp. H22C18031201]
MRELMTQMLSREPDLGVTVAADPLIAFDKLQRHRPDVIVLDLELPRMDGLTFLRRLMRDSPLPVVVCSGTAPRGTWRALQALALGAVEVLGKPRLDPATFATQAAGLLDAVRAAAQARPRPRAREVTARLPAPPPVAPPAPSAPPPPIATAPPASTVVAALAPPRASEPSSAEGEVLIALGASTGGAEALREVLTVMPEDAPPIVIVQHMPAPFTVGFALALARSCRIEVREARAGDIPRRGLALVAPGSLHLRVRGKGGIYRVEIHDGPPVNRHRPSVDVLFGSVARAAGARAVGALLTGMGADGADGLLQMRQAGAVTVAQDEASCVVYGMPREAVLRGAAQHVVPLSQMGTTLLNAARRLALQRPLPSPHTPSSP